MLQSTIAFPHTAPLPLVASFDLEAATSDGGLVWLQEADQHLGLCAAFAAVISDWRHGPVRHSLETLVRQRVFQITCGYADQNDADTLRADPLLKLVCGRLPSGDPDLASQPTLSRLENAATAQTCYRLAEALVGIYLTERERTGRPRRILLDLDGTDDPVHGQQERDGYHGYFRQHMYHPLLIFDGDTDQLITAVLRPGTVHASHGVVAILKRLVRLIRQRWPGVRIELRADSGFAIPALYDYCEAEHLGYTIGLVPNARLRPRPRPCWRRRPGSRPRRRRRRCAWSGRPLSGGHLGEPRRVIFKAEALPKGPNTRFVVTTRTDPPEALYDWYVDRGEPELWIKDLKEACFADRLSCHRFWANQFRCSCMPPPTGCWIPCAAGWCGGVCRACSSTRCGCA